MYLIKKKYIIKIISILIAIIIVPGLLLFVDWLITPNIDYSKWDKTICYIHDIGVGRSGVGITKEETMNLREMLVITKEKNM